MVCCFICLFVTWFDLGLGVFDLLAAIGGLLIGVYFICWCFYLGLFGLRWGGLFLLIVSGFWLIYVYIALMFWIVLIIGLTLGLLFFEVDFGIWILFLIWFGLIYLFVWVYFVLFIVCFAICDTCFTLIGVFYLDYLGWLMIRGVFWFYDVWNCWVDYVLCFN